MLPWLSYRRKSTYAGLLSVRSAAGIAEMRVRVVAVSALRAAASAGVLARATPSRRILLATPLVGSPPGPSTSALLNCNAVSGVTVFTILPLSCSCLLTAFH